MDDVLGFIVCAQGEVQDMTGVINDRALCLPWQRNCGTICMCSILLPSLGVIGTHGEACSFSAVEVSGNEAATPNRTSYRRETRPGHCYSTKSMSQYHTAGLNGSSTDMCLCQISLTLMSDQLYCHVKLPFLLLTFKGVHTEAVIGTCLRKVGHDSSLLAQYFKKKKNIHPHRHWL